jgi:hypothetical protein
MKFHVGYIGGEDRNGYSCFIHKAGCRDIGRAHYEHSYDHEGTLESAIETYLDDDMRDQGWDESIIKVFPCVEGAH